MPEEDDTELWRAVSETVRPLKSNRVPAAIKAKYVSRTKKLNVSVQRPTRDPVVDFSTFQNLEAGDVHNMDRNTAQKFKNGEMPVEAVLDLHGYTVERAEEVLHGFLFSQSRRNARCVLVITGKGGLFGRGVLRAELPAWLNSPKVRSLILSYVPAKPKDGGDGAFYILLKRNRPPATRKHPRHGES